MRTTLDLDRELLERAMEALDANTFRETVERALEAAVERDELGSLLDALKGSDATWSVEELLAYRRGNAS